MRRNKQRKAAKSIEQVIREEVRALFDWAEVEKAMDEAFGKPAPAKQESNTVA